TPLAPGRTAGAGSGLPVPSAFPAAAGQLRAPGGGRRVAGTNAAGAGAGPDLPGHLPPTAEPGGGAGVPGLTAAGTNCGSGEARSVPSVRSRAADPVPQRGPVHRPGSGSAA